MAPVKTSKPAKKKTAPKQAATKKPAKKKSTAPARGAVARRADYGAPIEGFFAKQPPRLGAILTALRKLVEEAAPEATASLKWGMPVYTIGKNMMCALGAHKAHVNLILSGPATAFPDSEGRLSGDGKTGRHLKLVSVDAVPTKAVRGWLKTAAKLARG
jgi:hypothetical protein